MNKIILIVISLLLVGCSSPEPGGADSIQHIVCIDGVKYVYFETHHAGNRGYGYMSVKFNRESKVELCSIYLPLPPE